MEDNSGSSDSSSSSTESSDNDERVHNIQSLLIKSQDSQRELDPNYAYKQKLGDLIFNANFEGGNLGFVEQIDQFDYDLMVRPDVANPRFRLWFNFTVSNQRPNQCVVFTFVNLSETLILFDEGLTPVVRSREQPNWWRLDEDQIFYYKSASHNNRRVLSLAFRFSSSHPNEHQFALFYPYTFDTLQSFINRCQVELIRRQGGRHTRSISRTPSPSHGTTRRDPKHSTIDVACLNVQVLATSVLFKPIYMLQVAQNGPDMQTKPQVIILRPSSGNLESVSSFVCQGYLDFVLSDDPVARATRRQLDSIILPMLDPDSVCAGNSRTDIFGQSTISPKLLETNPNVYATFGCARDKLAAIVDNSLARIIIIELKVNCNLIGSRIVGCHFDDSARMERHIHLARLLSRFADGFYLEKCEFSTRPNDLCHSSSTIFNFNNHKNVDQYKLEVSPFACYQRTLLGLNYEEFDQRKCKSLYVCDSHL